MATIFDRKSFLAKFNGDSQTEIHEHNHTLYKIGEPADALFYIHSGKVKITMFSEQGKEAIIGMHGADKFVGESCLTGQRMRIANAVTTAQSKITRLDRAVAVRLLHDVPEFSDFFLQHVLKRTMRVEADLMDQLFNSTEKRLARALLLMANVGKENQTDTVLGRVNQTTLAETIGTTRSRVNMFMTKFREMGFIEYNGHLKVNSSLLTMVLNDNPHLAHVDED